MMLELSTEKRLLLRAAFGRGRAAESAWCAWLERVNIDDIDAESQRALPNLCVNATAAASSDSRVQGLYRRAWYSNTLMLEQISLLKPRIAERGVRVLAAKQSAAVIKLRGCYPLDRFHLLVADDDLRETLAALRGSGWRDERSSKLAETALSGAHFARDGFWLQVSSESARNTGFWNRVERVDTDAGAFEVPGYLDRVLEAAAPKHVWHRTSMYQRALGTLLVIQYGDREPDWSALEQIGAHAGLALPLADTLLCLERDFGLSLPDGYIERLRRELATAQQVKEYELRGDSRSLWRKSRLLILEYRRFRELSLALNESFSLAEYLKLRWNVGNASGIASHVASILSRSARFQRATNGNAD